ncbi:hypothetical protein D9758_009539 [Tetrapyrgos nigripes]|uniref:Anthranilate phosphoribosyltransferase n=1 Tax=Tetrapyrgos nigripes TaxID=182062 RepID=A0A8H5LG47_9AGAR|nr:hypothetical protein D9758_009539 [Tetrapyrgos nigripes]
MTCTPDTFRPLLKRLVETPEYFSSSDLVNALNHIFTPSALEPSQISAFLTALHIHRVERRPESLAAAAQVLRERSLRCQIEGLGEDGDFVCDIVGTGGDGWNLFNVSTTAGVVAAGAGVRVIKHGSRASTSSSGSADLLQALGCIFVAPPPIPNDPEKVKPSTLKHFIPKPELYSPNPTPPDSPTTPTHSQSSSNDESSPSKQKYTPLPSIPFTFILAPHYHPSLAYIAPFRRQLPFRTMFNILGPLINPARPKGMVLGIAEPELGWTFARSLREGGVERGLVVCGEERLDEISCAGGTWVWSVGVDLEEALGLGDRSSSSSNENTETQNQDLDAKTQTQRLRDLKDLRKEEQTFHDSSVYGPITVTKIRVTPSMFGLPSHPLSEVVGGSPEENAEVFKGMLQGKGDSDSSKNSDPTTPTPTVGRIGSNPNANLTPFLNFTLLNASALLVVSGVAKTFREGTEMARESVRSGRAWEVFERFREVGGGARGGK